MTDKCCIHSKEDFEFYKLNKNQYNVLFTVQNNNIFVDKIVGIHLVKLMCEINSELYEHCRITTINENEIEIHLLLKHFFEDAGFSQQYIHLHIVQQDTCHFIGTTIASNNDINVEPELLPIQRVSCEARITTPHVLTFDIQIHFESSFVIPLLVEKIVGNILFKIVKRIKQFIHNI
jgi:hypothetical protein